MSILSTVPTSELYFFINIQVQVGAEIACHVQKHLYSPNIGAVSFSSLVVALVLDTSLKDTHKYHFDDLQKKVAK